MTGPATAGPRVLVGFDGSPAAIAALGVAADLLPGADATVLHLWTPPFAGDVLRRRLVERARTVDELMELVEQEGAAEAERVARLGSVVARAEGWTATARVARSYGGDGLRFAAVAQESGADLVLVGARGLSGVSAVLDSTTDLVVQHSPVPVLVVPFPMLVDERERARTGPVVVGWEELVGLGTPIQVGVATDDGKSVAVDRFEGMEPDVAGAFTAWRTNAWPYVHVAWPGGEVGLGDPAAPYAVDPTVTAGASRVLVTWRDTFGWEDDVERLAWLDGAGALLAEEVLHPRGAARTIVGEPLHVGSDTFLVIVEESGAPSTVLGRFLAAP